MIDIEELKKLAEEVKQWSNCNQAWLDSSEDAPAAFVGLINDDCEKYHVATIDCDQYYEPQDSIKLARFYAAANPRAVLELLSKTEQLESELAAVRQELEEAKRDSERLDWVSDQLDRMGSVWFLPSGEELRFAQVRHCGHTANFPTVVGLRAAIDAARQQTS